jgi:hypothetical protein
MSACSCDYDPPTFFRESFPAAKKTHRCDECWALIPPGTRYQRIAGKWEGHLETFAICPACQEPANYVTSNIPCYCRLYGGLLEDAIETLKYYAHELPGLLFGGYRRLVAIRRQPKYRRT